MALRPVRSSKSRLRLTRARSGLGLRIAGAVGLPLLGLAGWAGYQARQVRHDLPLPAALSGERRNVDSPAGRLAYYRAAPDGVAGEDQTPLLLIHSINAAASAYEVRPLYERLRHERPVYAVDLPGYGFSDRADRLYTPRLMTDAVLTMVDVIRARHGGAPIDAIALSLSCEFLARAAVERPAVFRSVGLISPTGFDARTPDHGEPGATRGMPRLYGFVNAPLWRRGLFDLLTSRVSIRFFLEKTWGSKTIDEGLLDYDYSTTHQPGAEHAPYSFVSGFLFSKDIADLYAGLRLPVWMVHGVRGDFVDYSRKRRVEGRSNWTIDVVQTGALPQFEMPEELDRRYDAFLDGVRGHPAPKAD